MALIASDKCRASFSELFDFYAPRVKSYMLRLGASALEAEDLAQDVMVTVWRKAGMYDRKQASVSTWIFRVARNRRIDKFRRTDSSLFAFIDKISSRKRSTTRSCLNSNNSSLHPTNTSFNTKSA